MSLSDLASIGSFVRTADLLLLVSFALAFGGQMFDAFVNVPVIFGDPPVSIAEWLKSPTAARTPGYFQYVIALALAAGAIGLVMWIATRPSTAILLSSLCAFAYVGLVFSFFLPTNRKLGFLASHGEGSEEAPHAPQELVLLASRWRMWNGIRLGIQFAGLVCAGLGMQG
jgi:anthrone oxygenase-like protein